MDYLSIDPKFNSLSLAELLRARDQFHAHLIHKANVVGTAVGRYLIRKDDPYPTGDDEPSRDDVEKQPRTIGNSEVRQYSWPCVLVFVSKWAHKEDFGSARVYSASDYIPPMIYLEDGRSVPICVVEAPYLTAAQPIDLHDFEFPASDLAGGYPVIASVQGEDHVASIGCLVTDGHTIYALTNHHVAGVPGETLYTVRNGEKVEIGKTSDKMLGKLPFEKAYEGWPGQRIYVNYDVGLIEVNQQKDWNPSVFGVGALGPLADLSIYNFTLKLIGCPVRANGAVSGPLAGQIAALFYRYKSMGGFEYVADFLIGSRSEQPLQTHPGDSGTVWVLETDDVRQDRMPIAVQWGGAIFTTRATPLPFALATNLSNICRELEVDVFRSRELAAFEYWGAVGHYTIGAFACSLVKDANLNKLLVANRQIISFERENLNTKVNDIKDVDGFVPLADVPDKVWKKWKGQKAPYGRSGRNGEPENPNHYSDLDFRAPDGNTLDSLTPNAKSLKPQVWRDFYDAVGWTEARQRGLLPFRVWQIYNKMVEFVRHGDVAQFITAAGVLAHYVGDACQPLHTSYLDDGDPNRNPDGTPAAEPHKHGQGFANGVHEAYETAMLDSNVDEVLNGLDGAIQHSDRPDLLQGGQNAGFAIIELSRRTRAKIHPMDIVEAYGSLVLDHQNGRPKALWKQFGKETLAVMADGCLTLAMLWESAWVEGNGGQISEKDLVGQDTAKIQGIYEKQDFIPSLVLDDIASVLLPVRPGVG